MAKLPISRYGALVLKEVAQPVSEVTGEIQKLIDDMAETMFAVQGVGLAAPQIGVSKRIVVVNSLEDAEKRDYLVLINPEIVNAEGKIVGEEGCLSVPAEFRTEVQRAERVKVRALNREGKTIEVEGVGLMARILQHEIDHLNGLFYVDRLSPAKRDLMRKKLKKGLAEA